MFLLAGAVVNVAVAWGCALAPWHEWADPIAIVCPGNVKWPADAPDWWPQPTRSLFRGGPGWDWLTVSHRLSNELILHSLVYPFVSMDFARARAGAGWPSFVYPFVSMDVARAGWPCRTLTALGRESLVVDDLSSFSLSWHGRAAVRPPWLIRSFHSEGRPVPLLPIWPGFAVNTLFYATLLWLLIPGLFVLRRFVRVRRGLCPKCAYPMGESVVCSECGKELPNRVRQAT